MRHTTQPRSILHYLHRRGVRLINKNGRLECRSPVGSLTPDVVRLITSNKRPILSLLQQEKKKKAKKVNAPPNSLETFNNRIKAARDWYDLNSIVQDVEKSYDQGHLSQDDAEDLIYLAMLVGRKLPTVFDDVKTDNFT